MAGESEEEKKMDKQQEKDQKQQAENERKAALEQKIRYRVACEAKAFDIVNRLLETSITEDYLKEACQFITRSHYEDVVEERVIVHLCGYPLCDNTLSNIPKKKYHISTKSNRVFDITERKKFCSNQCYKASKHLQKQVSETPVWGRENEPRVDFELLSTADSRGEVGEEVVGASLLTLQQEVLALEKLDSKAQQTGDAASKKKTARGAVVKPEKTQEDALNEKMEKLSLDKDSGRTKALERTSGAQSVHSAVVRSAEDKEKCVLENSMKSLTITEKNSHSDVDSDDDGDDALENVTDYSVSQSAFDSNTRTESSLAAEGAESNHCPDDVPPHENRDTSSSQNALMPIKPSDEALTQHAGESKTAYLMRLLDRKKNLLSKMADVQFSTSGQSSMQDDNSNSHTSIVTKAGALEDKPDPGKLETEAKAPSSRQHSKSTPSTQPSQPKVSPLEAICHIIQQWITPETLTYLGLQPLALEGQYDPPNTFLGDPEMQRKYQNFCQHLAGQEKDFEEVLGDEEVGSKEGEEPRKPLPNYAELAKQMAEFQLQVTEFLKGPAPQKKKHAKPGDEGDHGTSAGDEDTTTDRPIILPAVDSHNQQLIRRHIVLDRLDRFFSGLLPPLGLSVQDVSSILRELVFTFSFTSQNIVFKPAEWSLLSFVLLKMLAFKSGEVARVFKSETKGKTVDVVLSRLGHSSASLGQLVHNMLTEHTVAD